MSLISKTQYQQMPLEKGEKNTPFSNSKGPLKTADASMDHNLINRAQGGDEAAFQQMVGQLLPLVLRVCYRMVHDQAEAEDLAQEVMIKLWQKLSGYDAEKAALTTWVYRIASNHCLDHLRRKRPDQLDENYDEAIPAEQLKTLEAKELTSSVEGALALLSERQRLALVLFHYEGTSLSETADIMESSIEAIESLLRRARAKLKTILEPTWREIQSEHGEGAGV